MIYLRNVNFEYKNGHKALKNISLNINKGEITVVVGKNGSGKSTLGNVISRIFNYKSGEFTVDGLLVSKRMKKNDIRKRIGVVFQNPDNQVIFNRVYDDLAFTLNNLDVPKEKIETIIRQSLKSVGMEEYIYTNPHELSLGQKQRIAIASALSIEPSYIVFDEATSMLDAKGKKDIHKIVQDLAKKGIGIVFITNIMEEILLADKLVIIDKGEVVKVLKREEIIDNIGLLKSMGFEMPFIIKVILNLRSNNIEIENFDEQNILSILNKVVAI